MNQILLVLLGALGGFAVHAVSMKVSFKQRTIDNKIKVYDALIGTWVKMGCSPAFDAKPMVIRD